MLHEFEMPNWHLKNYQAHSPVQFVTSKGMNDNSSYEAFNPTYNAARHTPLRRLRDQRKNLG